MSSLAGSSRGRGGERTGRNLTALVACRQTKGLSVCRRGPARLLESWEWVGERRLEVDHTQINTLVLSDIIFLNKLSYEIKLYYLYAVYGLRGITHQSREKNKGTLLCAVRQYTKEKGLGLFL